MKQGILAKADPHNAQEEAREPPQGAQQEAAEGEQSGLDEKNPAYLKARELMLSKLYEEGAAQGIAQALSQAQSLQQGLVEQSMALGSAMDDATQGSVPDELVMSFMLDIVQEVVDIAQASGQQVPPQDLAGAVQEVLAQTVEAFGGDASQVRQEMGSMDPAQVGQAAMQAAGGQRG